MTSRRGDGGPAAAGGVGGGLDPDVLAAHSSKVGRLRGAALGLLESHFDASPRGYVAWSGGKDSTAALHLARQIQPDVAVCWFHSGFEFPETEQHIVSLAEEWSLNLHIVYARPDALTLLAAGGGWEHSPDGGDSAVAVSGAGFHRALIGAPSKVAHAVHGPGEVLGLRAEESSARRRTLSGTGGRYGRKDGVGVVAPVWSWRERDVYAYHEAYGVPLNGVYGKLAALGAPRQHWRAGLVLDGNVAQSGAVTWLRLGWPDLWSRLVDVLPRVAEWR